MFDCEILVNKNNRLPFNFMPQELIEIPRKYEFETKEYISKLVYEKFLELRKEALANGINIFIDNAYRSNLAQIKIFKYFVGKIGLSATLKRVAIPGCSEHQTGLAMDLGVIKDNKSVKITEEEAKFLEDNAYKYGFILRYPKGKEEITGYQYEPWHFRYVGEDLALYLKESGLTLEEYYLEKNREQNVQLVK